APPALTVAGTSSARRGWPGGWSARVRGPTLPADAMLGFDEFGLAVGRAAGRPCWPRASAATAGVSGSPAGPLEERLGVAGAGTIAPAALALAAALVGAPAGADLAMRAWARVSPSAGSPPPEARPSPIVETISGVERSTGAAPAAAVIRPRGALAAARWSAALELASMRLGRLDPAASATVTSSAGSAAVGACAPARALAIRAGSLGLAADPASVCCD